MQGGNQGVRPVELAMTLAVASMPLALASACCELLGMMPASAGNSAADQTSRIASGGLYA